MRRLTASILALGLLVGAAGCGDAGTPGATRATVTIFAPYRGGEAEHFLAGVDGWADDQGIDVRYTGTADLATDLQFRVDNADPPDIALVPQPGLVDELYRDGAVVALAPSVERTVATNLGEAARSLGRVDGVSVGFPYRVSVKGLVWYRPAELAALGSEPPGTLDDLADLVDAIVDRDGTPWCFGVEAQRATGWAATDWVENLVLRDWGPEVYAQWISGEVPFSDERIASSFEHFGRLVLAPGYLPGGVARAIATPVATAGSPLLATPPGCVLYQQASFALGWFPSGPDESVDFFALPSGAADPGFLEVGTDIVVAFDDRPAVRSVMDRLATPAAARPWVRSGGFVSPQVGLPPSTYGDASDRAVVEELLHAEGLVVDASDAMPPAIGTDLFWDRITKWMAGSITYDELAADLDAARGGSRGRAAESEPS